jgi:hypothetical protein
MQKRRSEEELWMMWNIYSYIDYFINREERDHISERVVESQFINANFFSESILEDVYAKS